MCARFWQVTRRTSAEASDDRAAHITGQCPSTLGKDQFSRHINRPAARDDCASPAPSATALRHLLNNWRTTGERPTEGSCPASCLNTERRGLPRHGNRPSARRLRPSRATGHRAAAFADGLEDNGRTNGDALTTARILRHTSHG